MNSWISPGEVFWHRGACPNLNSLSHLSHSEWSYHKHRLWSHFLRQEVAPHWSFWLVLFGHGSSYRGGRRQEICSPHYRPFPGWGHVAVREEQNWSQFLLLCTLKPEMTWTPSRTTLERSVGVMTCLVPTEEGILPNICNLHLSMQSGKPHPEASARLHN